MGVGRRGMQVFQTIDDNPHPFLQNSCSNEQLSLKIVLLDSWGGKKLRTTIFYFQPEKGLEMRFLGLPQNPLICHYHHAPAFWHSGVSAGIKPPLLQAFGTNERRERVAHFFGPWMRTRGRKGDVQKSCVTQSPVLLFCQYASPRMKTSATEF